MTISLGSVMGGPEKLPCDDALKSVWHYFKGNKSTPFLNVVFHFPGSLLTPPYTGLRTGNFSSKEQGFMIQVAVPKEIAQTTDRHAAAMFFLDAIEQALDLSKSRWVKHKIDFPFNKDREITIEARAHLNAIQNTYHTVMCRGEKIES